MHDDMQKIIKQKDKAYWERNQLVAALSKTLPSYLAKHPDTDKDWDDDWRTIVVVNLPSGLSADYIGTADDVRDRGYEDNIQMSWHVHDTDLPMFDHLFYQEGPWSWDGHTTEEKYRRLRTLVDPSPFYPGLSRSRYSSHFIDKSLTMKSLLVQSGQKTILNAVSDELRSDNGLQAYINAEVIGADDFKDFSDEQTTVVNMAISSILSWHRKGILAAAKQQDNASGFDKITRLNERLSQGEML